MNKIFKEKKKFDKPKHISQHKFKMEEETIKEIDKALRNGQYDEIDDVDEPDVEEPTT